MSKHIVNTKIKMSYKCCEAKDSISRAPATDEEIQQIVVRLHKTHTKSSAGGGDIKPMEELKPPGTGQKMLPIIEGLEERFKGKDVPKSKEEEVITRLASAQTKAWKARLDNPRILLYPERTLLCNNVERIVQYQTTGQTVKQALLDRREKWFN